MHPLSVHPVAVEKEAFPRGGAAVLSTDRVRAVSWCLTIVRRDGGLVTGGRGGAGQVVPKGVPVAVQVQ